MGDKKLQILVSAVNKHPEELPVKMNIQTDAVIVDQIIGEEAESTFGDGLPTEKSIKHVNHDIKVLMRREKGVGLSRNTAMEASDPEMEIIQFGDDDIVYDAGYAEKIIDEFEAHPEADIILFNVKAQEGRETYWNENFSRVTWRNYGRYPAYAICARRQKLMESGIRYSLLFGGGAPHMNGEDSLFLHDCLKSGLKLYRTPVVIGHENAGESTWFKGYTDKFFYDRGVLYHFLYGKMATILGFRYLFKNRRIMCSEKGLFKSFLLLVKGVKYGKGLQEK